VATTTTRPMTLAELEQLPEPKGFRYELHHGELVEVPFPKMGHWAIQQRLLHLLHAGAGKGSMVGTELGFVALLEYEYRRADVAYVAPARWAVTDPQDFFRGAPDLVIEVLSPSNTASEMRDKRKLCLENGSTEFWLVDPIQREVEVSTPDGHSLIYKSGQQIPLFFDPDTTLTVDSIFE
jgi:Uma2 family endonuclease